MPAPCCQGGVHRSTEGSGVPQREWNLKSNLYEEPERNLAVVGRAPSSSHENSNHRRREPTESVWRNEGGLRPVDKDEERLLRAEQNYQRILRMLKISAPEDDEDEMELTKQPKDAHNKLLEKPVVNPPSTGNDGADPINRLSDSGKRTDLHTRSAVTKTLSDNLSSVPPIPPLVLQKNKEGDAESLYQSGHQHRVDIESIRSSLRPVKLERPAWVQRETSSELSGPDGPSARADLAQRSNGESAPPTNMSLSTKGTIASSDVNPRKFIEDLWRNYDPLLPRKNENGTQKEEKLTATSETRSQGAGAIPRPLTANAVPKLRPLKESAWSGSLDLPSNPTSSHSIDSSRCSSCCSRNCGKAKQTTSIGSETSQRSSKKSEAGTRSGRGGIASARSDIEDSRGRLPSHQEMRNRILDNGLTDQYPDENDSGQTVRIVSANIKHLPNITRSRSIQDLSSLPITSSNPPPKKPPLRRVISSKLLNNRAPSRLRGRSLERYLAERMERDVSDLAEMRKQFRANPMPKWITQPKYDQLVEEAEKRREKVQERAKELLKQTKPFQFGEIKERREEEGSGRRRRIFADGERKENEKKRSRSWSDRTRKTPAGGGEHMERKQLASVLRLTMPQPSGHCSKHLPPPPTFKPSINPSVPDFGRLHARMEKQREAYKQEGKWSTVPQPFLLHQPVARLHQHHDPLKSDENKQKPKRQKPLQLTEAFHDLVRPTKSFELYSALSKKRLEEEKENRQPHQTDKILAERIKDSLQSRDREITEMIKSHKLKNEPAEDTGEKLDYMEQISEVKRRLSERPFIWERTQMEERRKRIDEKFHEILQDVGTEEILQQALGKPAENGGIL